MKSAGVNLVVQNWRGIMLPPKTPVAAQKLVIRALDVAKNSATFKKYLVDNMGTVSYLPGSKWGSYLKSEEARLTKLLKASGLL
jgi:putative tricarboxylic transport membrane protein